MNLISKFYSNQNKVFEFRSKNFNIWFNLLPKMIKKRLLDVTFFRDVEINIRNPTKSGKYYSFSPRNIKILDISVKTIDNIILKRSLYIPVPDRNDIYTVNGNVYIMVNTLTDRPFSIYEAPYGYNVDNSSIIRIKHIAIIDGLVKVVSSKYNLIDLMLLCSKYNSSVVGINDIVKVKKKEIANYETNGYVISKNRKIAVKVDDKLKKTAFYKRQILPAILQMKKFPDEKYLKRFEDTINFYDFGSYFKTWVGVSNFNKPNIEIISEVFPNIMSGFEKKHKYKFYTIYTKAVMYYNVIVKYIMDYIDNYVKNINSSKKPPSILHIDSNFVCKWLVSSNPIFRQQYYKDFTIFKDINEKETIYTNIKQFPDKYRSLDMSYIHYIDPINTPDNKKIGQIQRLSYSVEIDPFSGFFMVTNDDY